MVISRLDRFQLGDFLEVNLHLWREYNRIEELVQEWDGSNWVNDSKTTYSYVRLKLRYLGARLEHIVYYKIIPTIQPKHED